MILMHACILTMGVFVQEYKDRRGFLFFPNNVHGMALSKIFPGHDIKTLETYRPYGKASKPSIFPSKKSTIITQPYCTHSDK